ncbi:MAG: endonuclease/exonuclease/phosphatase family protein [Methyloceanibacter sp.]|nr:endonuclease/exonuclease/phosphatase family protein [Methyloceanibacter sp.]
MRVVTFNLWGGNERMEDVAKFLADAVVLQEVTREHGTALRQALGSLYPFALGETRLVILSKHPILAEGRIDRPGYPPWISLMLRWIRLDVNGTIFELAGVHLTRPFYPELQQQDIAALTEFVRSRTLPLVVAGDFNMSPWTEKLARFTRNSGLARYNTVHLTWPMRRGNVPLLPLVAIDNVFASRSFAAIATEGGPRLGSDHRLILVDIALAAPASPGEKKNCPRPLAESFSGEGEQTHDDATASCPLCSDSMGLPGPGGGGRLGRGLEVGHLQMLYQLGEASRGERLRRERQCRRSVNVRPHHSLSSERAAFTCDRGERAIQS